MKKLPVKNFVPDNAVYDEMDSPIGRLTIITSDQGLHAVLWNNVRNNQQFENMIAQLSRSKIEKTLVQAKQQINEYFQGQRKTFVLPLVLNGTDFQIQAWQQLLKIPYAATRSYAEQANHIGNKNKARAVGLANSMNRICIIVPCHRVIGSNGSLVGFAGGLEKKEFLLKLEQKNIGP